ncbi:MAG: N-acetylmuramoyl-L-alanine amidase [Sphingobacteriales bacterium]|nr:N-acetylmuramoyl-L-alanine amidase [Sphingobacteriales bacterium]
MNLKNKYSLLISFSVLMAFASCSSNPYAPTNKIYKRQAKSFAKIIKQAPDTLDKNWIGTTNFNLRKPNFVIIHHTAQKSSEQTLRTFTMPKTQVSAHYIIGGDGKVYHILNDYLRAWHGGVARWGNVNDINSVSIGIELDNDGLSPFSEIQVNSLMTLLATLKKSYNIPAANFIGHADIAPARKTDPSNYFPWQKLSEKGFGLWQDAFFVDTVPESFNPQDALRIIGYNTSDMTAAIRAFKLHFIQSDITPILTDEDKRVLYNLYRKYL